MANKKSENPFAPQYDDNLKNTDAVINHISGEYHIEQHPVSGEELGLPAQTVISVFHENQIHILGSTSDIDSFSEFVRGQ